jgi:hypothetical protein
MTNFNEMTAKELVAAYNVMAKAMDDALVIRFSDRKAGIRRCEKLKARYDEIFAAPTVEPVEPVEKKESADIEAYEDCPHCGVHLSNGVLDNREHMDELKSGGFKAIGESNAKLIEEHRAETTNQFQCLGCGGQFGPALTLKVSKSRSAAIAASWTDSETAAKRAQRHAVRVAGQEFRSVRAAFAALKLPISKHIKFRMELKAAGQLNAFGYDWEIIEA